MNLDQEMQQFVERLHTSGVAAPSELRGCSLIEIVALEKKYGVALPRSYRLFLSRMGHNAGKLGNRGEFDLSYKDALRLNEQEQAFWDRCRRKYPDWKPVPFPRNGLIFCERQGNPHYWMIICEGQEDSPVFRFDYDEEPVRFEQTEESLLGFLEELRRDAEHWIQEGTL